MPQRASSSVAPTTCELAARVLEQKPSKQALDAVAALYVEFLGEASDDERTLSCLRELDTLRYLEDALWPLADVIESVRDCRHHVKKAWLVSVLLLVGFRAREDSSSGIWTFLKQEDAGWKTFMTTLWTVLAESGTEMEDDAKWTLKEQTALTQFLILCFQSLDVPQVAASVLQMTSLPLWTALSPTQRALEFQTYPKLERHWNRIMTTDTATKTEETKTAKKNKRRKLEPKMDTPRHEQTALVHRLDEFFQVLKDPVDKDTPKQDIVLRVRFVAMFLVLLVDLLSQLPTRRFLLTVLRRRHMRTALRNSVLIQHALQTQSVSDRQALSKQLTLLNACMQFPIDAHTGTSLSPWEYREQQSRHIQALQQRAFKSFQNSRVEELAIAPCGHIADASNFTDMLNAIVAADRSRLSSLAITVGVLADQTEDDAISDAELVDFFKEEYSVPSNDDNDVLLSNAPVFPTELDIWNEMLDCKDGSVMDRAAKDIYSTDDANLFPLLPVRKLGLQFLNLTDYLQRNYELYRIEAAQDIRSDLEAVINQLGAVRSLRSYNDNDTIFRGFSPAAVPLASALQIVKVGKPALGQMAPASVIAHLEVELSSRHNRKHFDCYQTKEVVFLVTIKATTDEGAEMMGFQKQSTDIGSFPENFGVQYVRAAEIVEVTDATDTAINDENPVGNGSKRTFKLALDGMQYKNDLEAGHLEAYEQVNLLVRRKPRDNNFKAVLDTIAGAWRDANKEELLPVWLHDLFLGYGDPAAALYKSIYKANGEKQLVVRMDELLLDGGHAVEAGGAMKLVDADDETRELNSKDAYAPFTYVEDMRDGTTFIRAYHKKIFSAAPPTVPSSLRYTKAQIAAIRQGICEGLTVLVGPPGTGKTDVAVQLVLNLYRTTPTHEKVLIVAHSNQALNDFFAKILARNVINEAEIVRMGHGQFANEGYTTEHENQGVFHADFSRNGRVSFLLARRAALLAEVEQMAQWLMKRDPVQYVGLGGGSASYSCENASIFYQFHMKALLDAARECSELSSNDDKIVALTEFFTLRKATAPEKVETLREFAVDIESYFAELRRLQPFELLQTPRQRGDMYLIHHARIIAMTCTHAALNYRKLTDLGLTFGSLLMEEAGQISELDSLAPLLLACSKKAGQTSNDIKTSSGLKRVVLMGDAKQLPPVVKSPALKTYAHFDQSLFSRLLRLGVPHVVLDKQGRSRSELADIYRWCYDDISSSGEKTMLGDLPRVSTEHAYQVGNAGFSHVAQLVDLSGSEERQSKPFAFENEEEARFVVALFRYMMRIGYRSEQVTILTTYNAQKELLKRLLRADNPDGLKACKVSTVDRFQGQQNDFVLLSTVRSGTSLGHLRDVRRASTAFSRARLGLYVVGCRSTLEKSRELQPFLSRLVSIADKHDSDAATTLALVPSERVATVSKENAKKSKFKAKSIDVVYVSDRKQLEKVVAELNASIE
ncbi:DEAD helicases superfamily protein (Aquarius) [Phytophthora palmivora]|uniref:DEAD helicases superfamily protein (Aquarius) n=1 Tax=Phytophthora palmivora TaxID=4796 RepID=A0A2P4XBU6_9STRA|nr:DEAD helicases superfamily protein (Aquarius) [Phytophthora palmivora]